MQSGHIWGGRIREKIPTIIQNHQISRFINDGTHLTITLEYVMVLIRYTWLLMPFEAHLCPSIDPRIKEKALTGLSMLK